MAVTVTARDGVVTTCSSWAAWRKYLPVIRQRPCGRCSGEGHVEVPVMNAGGKGWRWQHIQCTRCHGSGRGEV